MTAVRANTAFCNGNSRRRGRSRDRDRRQRQPPPSFPFRAASSCKKMQRQLSKHHQHKDGTMATVAAQDEGAERERRAETVCTAHDGYCAAAAASAAAAARRKDASASCSKQHQSSSWTNSAKRRQKNVAAARGSNKRVSSEKLAPCCRLHVAGGTDCCPQVLPQPGLTLTQFEAVPKMPSGCPGQVQQQTAAGRTRTGQDKADNISCPNHANNKCHKAAAEGDEQGKGGRQ